MNDYFLNEVNSYLNYFGCLVLGVFVTEKFLSVKPNEKDSFSHKFLVSCTTVSTGALLGSYFYELTYPDPDLDSENDSEEK